jgi:hypothetical protein
MEKYGVNTVKIRYVRDKSIERGCLLVAEGAGRLLMHIPGISDIKHIKKVDFNFIFCIYLVNS